MRFLFTADWQADWESLDVCKKASEEVLHICRDKGLEGFTIIGDLKRAYNPVDCRVTQFWTDFIHKSTELGLNVILVLGNHDRVGMYSEAQNWFPILERAGAIVIHKEPRIVKVRNGIFVCLPFDSSVQRTKEWAKRLTEMKAEAEQPHILLFHADLQNSLYNVLTRSSSRLSAKDLLPENYTACIGGHLHLHQYVAKNVLYTGSPFATDWGEANQQKGYVVVDGDEISFVKSKIPGWYDPTWPNYNPSKSYKDARVRVHVPIKIGEDYGLALEKARKTAEKKYAGAVVYTVAEFQEDRPVEVKISSTDSDEQKIEAYVRETIPDGLKQREEEVVSYLNYKLKKASAGLFARSGEKITFVKAKAKNFLSYPQAEFNFEDRGLCLVTGKNKDWPGRSNGVGKTNLLQLIPVALFGSTFKGQKHDRWARRGMKDSSYVSLTFQDRRKRKIKIVRGRNPGRLQLFVDGIDHSSGMQGSAKTGTQGLIEQLSGFTWQTLANAVYIDQQEVASFLNSSQAERKQVLERFQNLERFQKAVVLAKADQQKLYQVLGDIKLDIELAAGRVYEVKESLSDYDQADKVNVQFALEKLVKLQMILDTRGKYFEGLRSSVSPLAEKLKEDILVLSKKLDEVDFKLSDDIGIRLGIVRRNLVSLKKLATEKKCPTCLQNVSKGYAEGWVQELNLQEEELVVGQKLFEAKSKKLGRIVAEKEVRLAELEVKFDEAFERIDEAKAEVKAQEKVCKGLERISKSEKEYEEKLKRKLAKAQTKLVLCKKILASHEAEDPFLEYCIQAFSRNGIPAFLNEQLCPRLNQAADYYSEIFSGKEIQIRFQVIEGEFDVRVLNAHGGEQVADQSAGEKKMAALITVFALREIAPPCNVLILDEPGDGLDDMNARVFAQGVKRLKDKFSTLLLITHNSVIASELSGEQIIRVEKSGGVSQII